MGNKTATIHEMKLARNSYVLYLYEKGMRQVQIAKKLGVTRENIRQRLNTAKREQRRFASEFAALYPTAKAVVELLEGETWKS